MVLDMCFRTKIEKKIVVSALKMLLKYYELTRCTEGTLTRIADTVAKSHLTTKRYLWELCRRGIVSRNGRIYRFDPERIREALRRAENAKPELDNRDSISIIRRRVRDLELAVKELSKRLSVVEEKISKIPDGKCRQVELIRELDEWSKSMDKWADEVEKRLDDLEERIRTLTSMILRVLDKH